MSAEDLTQANEELAAAIAKWLRVKAAEPDGELDDYLTSDPVLLDWVLVAGYTSVELEAANATASAYDCRMGQPAYASRGLALAGVDRWRNGG